MTLAKLLRKEGEKFTHYKPSVTRFLTTLKRCLFCQQNMSKNFPAVTTHVSTYISNCQWAAMYQITHFSPTMKQLMSWNNKQNKDDDNQEKAQKKQHMS